MTSSITRLRRWFALSAVLMVAIVAGMYFYARFRLRGAIHAIPAKLGLDIQQTADGFSVSKSAEGRTQFTVSASKAVQFKGGGRAELHDVKIVIYGKDSSRFDRITGDDFEYDPSSGDVTAKGRVLIDLQENPEGVEHSDQTPPAQPGNPIHLETDGLTFNKNTGDASATGKVEFHTPQATGSAVGIQYVAKTGRMDLLSAVALSVNRPQADHVMADRGVITKQPHQVVLSNAHLTRERQQVRAGQATFFLRDDNTVDRILAEGNVESETSARSAAQANSPVAADSELRERSDRAELNLAGTRNLLTQAVLSGNVRVALLGGQRAEATAGKATLHFGPEQVLRTIHAEGGVRLTQKGGRNSAALSSVISPLAVSATPSGKTRPQDQDIDMTAPVIDFTIKDGRRLDRAVTSGPPEIVIAQPETNQKAVITAGKFTATFTDKNRLAALHGEPNAKIVSGVLDVTKADPSNVDARNSAASAGRVSTSRLLDVVFQPQGGVSSITQTDGFTYVDGPQKAWGRRGVYTAADQVLVLTGSPGALPRVVDGGLTTTAEVIRVNRVTGDAGAVGNVKSTYSELKPQPDGALLASSDPIHVTSAEMTARRASAVAVYTGHARLWQDANMVEAPRLQFDRERRSLLAEGSEGEVGAAASEKGSAQPVSTVLMQVDKRGKATPVRVTSARLRYVDGQRTAFFDGGVTAKATDATMTSRQMTVFLKAQSAANLASAGAAPRPFTQNQDTPSPNAPGQIERGVIERIVAEGRVAVMEPSRSAHGERLVYTAADDKFVLTGGSPSIFDAEQHKTTGDSLTFYRHDDRVLVEGRKTSLSVTETQVAR